MNKVQIRNTLRELKETFYIYLSTPYNTDWNDTSIGDLNKLDSHLINHLSRNNFSTVITLLKDNRRKDLSFVYRDGCLHREENKTTLALICTPNSSEEEIVKSISMNRDKEITYLKQEIIKKRRHLESLKRYCSVCNDEHLPVELNVCSHEYCDQILCSKHVFKCSNCNVYLCLGHINPHWRDYIFCNKCLPKE